MMSENNDIVLIAGKGHENYQEINGVKTHFDDREIVLAFNQTIKE
jgi:UDP-N-acetylmuramoyl-L-alanyl-D-glutamate--2,6-diaminopimelate ligase